MPCGTSTLYPNVSSPCCHLFVFGDLGSQSRDRRWRLADYDNVESSSLPSCFRSLRVRERAALCAERVIRWECRRRRSLPTCSFVFAARLRGRESCCQSPERAGAGVLAGVNASNPPPIHPVSEQVACLEVCLRSGSRCAAFLRGGVDRTTGLRRLLRRMARVSAVCSVVSLPALNVGDPLLPLYRYLDAFSHLAPVFFFVCRMMLSSEK